MKISPAERAKQVQEKFKKQQEEKAAQAQKKVEETERRAKEADKKRQSVNQEKAQTAQTFNEAVEGVVDQIADQTRQKEEEAQVKLKESESLLKKAAENRQSAIQEKVQIAQKSNAVVEDVNQAVNQARQKEEEEARLKLEKSLKKEDAAITRAAQATEAKVAGSRNFKETFEISSQASGMMSRSGSTNNSTISSRSSGVTTNSSISSGEEDDDVTIVSESELSKDNKDEELSLDEDDDLVNNTTTSQIQNEVIQEEEKDVRNLIVNSDAPIQQITEVEDDNLSESEQSVVNLTKPNIQENTQVEEEDEYDLNDFEEDDLSESEKPIVNLTKPNIQENTQVEEEDEYDLNDFEEYEEEVKESQPVVNQVINNPAPQNKLPQESFLPEISNKKSTVQQRAGASELLRDAILMPIDEEDQKITADILNAATISLVANAINIAQAQIIQVQKDLKNISPVITKEEDIDKILNQELLAQAEELGRQQMAATKFDSKSAKTAFDEIEKAFNQESDVEKVKTSINSARDGVQDTALQAYANIVLGILESNEPDGDRDKGLERVKEEFQFLGNDDSRSKEENFDMMGSAYVNLLNDRDITNNVKQVIAISFQKAVTSQEYGKPREDGIDQEEENELPIKKLPPPSMPVIEEETDEELEEFEKDELPIKKLRPPSMDVIEEETDEELEEFEKDDIVIDQQIDPEEEITESTTTQEKTKQKELNLNLDGCQERTDWMKNYVKPGAKGLVAIGLVSMAFPPVSMVLAIPMAGLFLYATRDGKDLEKEQAEKEAEFNKSVALFNSYEDFMPKKKGNEGKPEGKEEELDEKIEKLDHDLNQYQGQLSNTGALAQNLVNQEDEKLKGNKQVLHTEEEEIKRMQQKPKQNIQQPMLEEKQNLGNSHTTTLPIPNNEQRNQKKKKLSPDKIKESEVEDFDKLSKGLAGTGERVGVIEVEFDVEEEKEIISALKDINFSEEDNLLEASSSRIATNTTIQQNKGLSGGK